jgi:SAM-dependent methyltransferase
MQAAAVDSHRFTAWPAAADLPLDVVVYGPDIPTEADLRLLGRLEGKRVLELGCGAGPISVAMTKQGAKVIAVEPSAEQVGHARRLSEREEVVVELRNADLADLAFVRADTIDLVVSVYGLAAVADLDRVFRQVHRVLRPELPFVLSLPHPAWRMVEGGDPPTLRRTYWDTTPVGDDNPVTISDLFTSLTRANFRVDTVLEPEPQRGPSWVPPTLIVRARKVGT